MFVRGLSRGERLINCADFETIFDCKTCPLFETRPSKMNVTKLTRIEGLESDMYLNVNMHKPIGRKDILKTDLMSGRETGAEAGGVNARGLLES